MPNMAARRRTHTINSSTGCGAKGAGVEVVPKRGALVTTRKKRLTYQNREEIVVNKR